MRTPIEGVVERVAARYAARYAGNTASAVPFAIVVRGRSGLDALRGLDLVDVGQAYLAGELDIDGEMARALAVRDLFTDFHPVRRAWHYVRPRLGGRVLREHLYEHRPDTPYDAIVNLGVTEHLPDYRATLAHYARLLKPGGVVYLDASAARARNDLSTFLLQHLFPGNGTPMVLHEYLAEVARSPFSVRAVYDDRRNYELTAARWLDGLEAHRAEIERRWGRPLFRAFQLYLAGCADGFARDTVQAYRVVLQLTA